MKTKNRAKTRLSISEDEVMPSEKKTLDNVKTNDKRKNTNKPTKLMGLDLSKKLANINSFVIFAV